MMTVKAKEISEKEKKNKRKKLFKYIFSFLKFSVNFSSDNLLGFPTFFHTYFHYTVYSSNKVTIYPQYVFLPQGNSQLLVAKKGQWFCK